MSDLVVFVSLQMLIWMCTGISQKSDIWGLDINPRLILAELNLLEGGLDLRHRQQRDDSQAFPVSNCVTQQSCLIVEANSPYSGVFDSQVAHRYEVVPMVRVSITQCISVVSGGR
jgi:hypothetical protein